MPLGSPDEAEHRQLQPGDHCDTAGDNDSIPQGKTKTVFLAQFNNLELKFIHRDKYRREEFHAYLDSRKGGDRNGALAQYVLPSNELCSKKKPT